MIQTFGGGTPYTTPPMTPAQESHLQQIKDQFAQEVDAKYRAGALEHGGTLLDLTTLALIEEAMKEAVDQYVYLATVREKLLRGDT